MFLFFVQILLIFYSETGQCDYKSSGRYDALDFRRISSIKYTESKKTCVPNEKWKENHQSCICNSDGSDFNCLSDEHQLLNRIRRSVGNRNRIGCDGPHQCQPNQNLVDNTDMHRSDNCSMYHNEQNNQAITYNCCIQVHGTDVNCYHHNFNKQGQHIPNNHHNHNCGGCCDNYCTDFHCSKSNWKCYCLHTHCVYQNDYYKFCKYKKNNNIKICCGSCCIGICRKLPNCNCYCAHVYSVNQNNQRRCMHENSNNQQSWCDNCCPGLCGSQPNWKCYCTHSNCLNRQNNQRKCIHENNNIQQSCCDNCCSGLCGSQPNWKCYCTHTNCLNYQNNQRKCINEINNQQSCCDSCCSGLCSTQTSCKCYCTDESCMDVTHQTKVESKIETPENSNCKIDLKSLFEFCKREALLCDDNTSKINLQKIIDFCKQSPNKKKMVNNISNAVTENMNEIRPLNNDININNNVHNKNWTLNSKQETYPDYDYSKREKHYESIAKYMKAYKRNKKKKNDTHPRSRIVQSVNKINEEERPHGMKQILNYMKALEESLTTTIPDAKKEIEIDHLIFPKSIPKKIHVHQKPQYNNRLIKDDVIIQGFLKGKKLVSEPNVENRDATVDVNSHEFIHVQI